jgi:glucose/arabinose dehydrogenase
MPAIADSIRSVLKYCCIASIPLLAACGDLGGLGGDDGVGPAVAAMCGRATATVVTPPAPPPGAPPAGIALKLQKINNNFTLTAPLFVTSSPSPGDANRLFVVEQGGLIKIVNRNAPNNLIGTFLNISKLVNAEGEGGLHGLAFDPGYATNRRFYVSYTNPRLSEAIVARYLRHPTNVNQAVAASGVIIMRVPVSGQHFGGMLAFGRDGFLYISRGDGGPAPDQLNRAQDLSVLNGKLLRIDVSDQAPEPYGIPPDNPCVGVGRGEIWSIGLRNPWRFSFDRATGNLYIADVGEDFVEEVNVATVATGAGRAANYGWKIMEGKQCFEPADGCNQSAITQPTLDYTHPAAACGGSITGGYVYRGTNPALAALRGTYFYADWCKGFVRSFRFNGQVEEHFQWPLLASGPFSITSFGEDNQGELYITTSNGGLFRIVP